MPKLQLPDGLSQKLVADVQEHLQPSIITTLNLVSAYAASANAKAEEIPALFAGLYLLFEKGEVMLPDKKQ